MPKPLSAKNRNCSSPMLQLCLHEELQSHWTLKLYVHIYTAVWIFTCTTYIDYILYRLITSCTKGLWWQPSVLSASIRKHQSKQEAAPVRPSCSAWYIIKLRFPKPQILCRKSQWKSSLNWVPNCLWLLWRSQHNVLSLVILANSSDPQAICRLLVCIGTGKICCPDQLLWDA